MIYKSLKSYLASSCLSGSSNATASSYSTSSPRRTSSIHRASASTAVTGTNHVSATSPTRPHVQFSQKAQRRAQVAAPIKLYVRQTTDVRKSHVGVTLPRHLVRPAFREVDGQALRAVDPELENVPVQYVRDGLRMIGSRMLSVLAQTAAAPVSSKIIPREIQVTINNNNNNNNNDDASASTPTSIPTDASSGLTTPTHVLAIYGSQPAPSSSRRVMLVPTHSIVLAAHCASLPHFPESAAASLDVADANANANEAKDEAGPSSSTSHTYTVPVVPMGIPSPETFVPLSSYLYNGRADQLFAHFMPSGVAPEVSAALQALALAHESVESTGLTPAHTLIAHLTTLLSAHLQPQQLLQHALRINGLWRNACALGVADEGLWRTMEVMWEVVVGAMCIGNAQAK